MNRTNLIKRVTELEKENDSLKSINHSNDLEIESLNKCINDLMEKLREKPVPIGDGPKRLIKIMGTVN